MEEKISFLVQGSSEKPYHVNFFKQGDEITATCDCKAGKFSGHCKHRISILTNSSKHIVSENLEDVKKVSSWIKGSEIESALNYFLEMQELEKNAKSEAKKAKKIFVDIMTK